MENIIINIGRQIGSGGRIIAKKLAEEFNCTLYDREILNLAAKESGFCEQFFEQNDECKGFFKSLFNFRSPIVGEGNFYDNSFSQEGLYKFQSDAIREAAKKDNCVFVGRTADVKECVNIFISANIEQRIACVSKRHDISEEEAKKFIRTHEDARSSYYNYYTGKKWGHSESYDLCINSTILGIDETTSFIAQFIRKRFNIPTENTNKQKGVFE